MRKSGKASEAASLLGRRSFSARVERWGGKEAFRARMSEFGQRGGRGRKSKERLARERAAH